MTAEHQMPDCHKFSFPLKGRTERKRLIEAKQKLAGLYPFEVPEKNILVYRTGEKGFYDVYISQNEIKKKSHLSRTLGLLVMLVISVFIFVLAVRHGIKAGEAATQVQKELERQEAENGRIQKEKESRLEKLKEEYSRMHSESYDRIYPYIERIYSAMGKNTTIENISIDKSSFSVEVTTGDAMKILQNFEENDSFSSIKMNRTTVNGSLETVTYSGVFSRFLKEADDNLSIDEKIEFYEKEISFVRERRKRQSEASLSEYIKDIREILHKDRCNEQYIQLRGSGKSTEVEFFILSSSRNILNFIGKIQEQDDNLRDIKQLRIRNSDSMDRVQTTICFDSGMELKQGDGLLYEQEDKKISAEEINSIFYKAPAVNPASIPTVRETTRAVVKPVSKKPVAASTVSAVEKKNARPVVVKNPARMEKLTFIGITKTGEKTLVIAKDMEMDSIYKIPVSQTETDGDFCLETESGYQARIRGKYYEVKK